ncbi:MULTISPECIES: transposase [unclassified Pseudoalteromonas]|uniref:REP-associated tyrosine transposase n=1 Tax=unclassified Pseudoalteromonas TaxID=194690 RepID=UPI000C07488A|nr:MULTISPECIES: transposase [unclassified Pseudoalteromonas]MDP2636155.1 transposase [Pseudoalteromonas sp. 1_MG-2023]PHN88272.1 transposase [Pseudoalteromonas sp. 3D05]
MCDSNKRVKGRHSARYSFYSVTICCEQRIPIFANFGIACVVSQQIYQFSRSKSVSTICFSLMPDHLHWLFQLQDETMSLSRLIGQFKSTTKLKVNRKRGLSGRIWQANFYDHRIRAESDLIQQSRYIVANPLRAGLVKNIGNYPFWDCCYLG